jgi:DNA-binding transcriptional LysR family regulator
MDFYQLRTFTAAAELGTLARACDRLHLSAPAASAHIKALEAELGVSLFFREPKGLKLTFAGTTLLVRAQRMLALAEEFRSHAQKLSGKLDARLRFGAFYDPTLLRIGELTQSLLAQHPMLDVELHQRPSREVIAGVTSGEFDAGMALCESPPDTLCAMPLARLRYRIAAPAAWADQVKNANWTTIANLPWISTPVNGSHFQMAAQIFERCGFRPKNVVEGDSEAIVTSLILAGVGLGLMREDLAKEAEMAGKGVVLVEGHAETSLMLLYIRSRAEDPVIQAVVDAVQGIWRTSKALSAARAG